MVSIATRTKDPPLSRYGYPSPTCITFFLPWRPVLFPLRRNCYPSQTPASQKEPPPGGSSISSELDQKKKTEPVVNDRDLPTTTCPKLVNASDGIQKNTPSTLMPKITKTNKHTPSSSSVCGADIRTVPFQKLMRRQEKKQNKNKKTRQRDKNALLFFVFE